MRSFLILCIVSLVAPAVYGDVPASVQALIFRRQLPEEPPEFVYCLSVDGEDVSSGFIARLQRPDLTIVGASQCTQNIDPQTGGSFHTSSRRKAMFLRLSDISDDGATDVTVEFESYHHGLYASGSTLRLELIDGVWRVAEVLRLWEA